jgi:hypothetical protein
MVESQLTKGKQWAGKEPLKLNCLTVGKGGLPPLWLSATDSERGQARLPDHEILFLEPFL